jgi:hypothetical protein
MVSQSTTSPGTNGGLFIINAQNDTLPRVSEIGAGASPGLMVLSPTRAVLLAFDSIGKSVQIINTTSESNAGGITLPGPTTSMVVPATTPVGYAAVASAASNLWVSPGAIEVLNLGNGSITTAIGVPSAQTVVSNPNGTQLLVFSNDSDSISVISPLLAAPPIDQGCDTAPNSVCTVIPGFDRPVNAIYSGSSVYILNCGAECLGTQASVQVLDLSTMTAGPPLPVDGATFGFINGSTLYVAGTSPTNNACTGEMTAATKCGRLDAVDLGSMTVTNSYVITDGYHDHMDLSAGGQLFIGSSGCTGVGNVNNPNGEVRGCLSIFNTNNNSVVIPPDNGDVTGLQGFTSRNVEYVVEGGNLRIYDTTKDVLQTTQITLTGQLVDVKAVDFF